jgi:DNA (cytosine-5)-methyltransferase 1
MVEDTREVLKEIGLPYIIENVVGAPLISPVQICGSGLGLRIWRHRLFESNIALTGIPCEHEWQIRDKRFMVMPNGPGSQYYSGIVHVHGRGDGSHFRNLTQLAIWSQAMGIDWMTIEELSQAIPPLYTFHLGKQLIKEA